MHLLRCCTGTLTPLASTASTLAAPVTGAAPAAAFSATSASAATTSPPSAAFSTRHRYRVN